jgi:hypothetical protein
MRRALRLIFLGALVGPLLDRAHAWTGAIAYDGPVTFLGVPWWVSLVYTGAALGIGLTHPLLDRALRRPQKVALGPGVLAAGFVGMSALWIASGLIPGSNAAIALVLAAGAAAMLAAFDRTWQGAVLAAGTGAGGVAVEATLVRLRLFHHARPDVLGLPIWLPLLYVGGSVAIGNLARYWAARETTSAHQAAKSAIPRSPILS